LKEFAVFRLLAARAALVSLITVTVFLAPSLGHAALYELYSWPARVVMGGLLAGVWCSVFAYAAARERLRRIEADDAALTTAHERFKAALDRPAEVRLAALFAPSN